MKYIKMLRAIETPLAKYKGCTNFQWQWAVWWQEKTYATGIWQQKHIIADSRSEARRFARVQKDRAKSSPGWCRNVCIKRRLVQANWDEYTDSFTYNAKGNGNGR